MGLLIHPVYTRLKWSISQLPNLEFWYDASVGITITVSPHISYWADQSGNGRTLECNPEYWDKDALRPHFVASGIGGQPTVNFPGTFYQYLATTGLTGITSKTKFTITYVCKTYNNNRYHFGMGNNEYRSLAGCVYSNTHYLIEADSYNVSIAADYDNPHIYTMVWDSTLAEASRLKGYKNGASLGSASTPATPITINCISLGTDNGSSGTWANVDIAEFVGCSTALSTSNLSTLWSVLGAKYGITI